MAVEQMQELTQNFANMITNNQQGKENETNHYLIMHRDCRTQGHHIQAARTTNTKATSVRTFSPCRSWKLLLVAQFFCGTKTY
jgi:hypothetical protein